MANGATTSERVQRKYTIFERWYTPRGNVVIMVVGRTYSIGAATEFIAKRRAQCTPFGCSDFWLQPL